MSLWNVIPIFGGSAGCASFKAEAGLRLPCENRILELTFCR